MRKKPTDELTYRVDGVHSFPRWMSTDEHSHATLMPADSRHYVWPRWAAALGVTAWPRRHTRRLDVGREDRSQIQPQLFAEPSQRVNRRKRLS